MSMQRKLGFDTAPGVSSAWRHIYGELTDQHRKFHTSNLHFLPVVTLDERKRPWVSMLTGEDDKIGWIKERRGHRSRLELNTRIWEADPLWQNLRLVHDQEGDRVESLIAGVGVEVSTRRRNKLAGKMVGVRMDDQTRRVTIDVEVNEATGYAQRF